MSTVFIDGDFKSGKGACKYHCSPTCHPAQTGPDWLYGCLHPAWPTNQDHSFCPIVECVGDKRKCDLKRFIRNIRKTLQIYERELKK